MTERSETFTVEFSLPGKPELRTVLGGVMESACLSSLDVETREKAVEAAAGLTTIEAENAFSLSFVQTRTIEPSIVAKEKAQAVKKSGLLEIVEVKETLNSIGGLDLHAVGQFQGVDAGFEGGVVLPFLGMPTLPAS